MKQILSILALVCINFQSIAQDTTKMIQLDRVLVVGVRADNKTPVTQKTIGDSALLSAYQGEEIPMLLNQFPSVNTNSDGGHGQGYTYFSIRGVNQPRINMTLNGVPLNEPEDHGVYTSNFPCFINSIQSVQIQRGVGTSTNGAGSFVGSINFQSKSGLKKLNEIQIGGGSYNTFRANVSHSTGLSKKNIALFVNAGGFTTNGFREKSGSKGGTIFVSLGHYGNKNITRFTVFNGLSRNQMAWDGTDESVLKQNYRTNERGNDNPDTFRQTHLQLQNILTITSKSRLSATLFYNNLKGNYDVYSFADLPKLGYYAKESQYSNWIGLITQYDYKSPELDINVGVSTNFYRRNHSGREYYDTNTYYDYKNYGDKNELSGFAKVNYGNDLVRCYADLQVRYAEFKYNGDVSLPKQSWLFFNPKIGAKVFVNNKIDIYYTLGVSHREPTRSVMFNGGFYLTDFNKVKPETVYDIELGTNIRTNKLKLQGNLYIMLFENEIIPAGPLGANSLPMMINVQNSFRTGVEVDLDYKITKNLVYNMTTTLSRNKFADMDYNHPFTPSLLVKQTIMFKTNNFMFDINHQYNSKSYIDVNNTATTNSFNVFGFNASYQYKNYRLLVAGNNVTNNKYFSNGYLFSNTKYLFPNALSNYYVTLKVTL